MSACCTSCLQLQLFLSVFSFKIFLATTQQSVSVFALSLFAFQNHKLSLFAQTLPHKLLYNIPNIYCECWQNTAQLLDRSSQSRFWSVEDENPSPHPQSLCWLDSRCYRGCWMGQSCWLCLVMGCHCPGCQCHSCPANCHCWQLGLQGSCSTGRTPDWYPSCWKQQWWGRVPQGSTGLETQQQTSEFHHYHPSSA